MDVEEKRSTKALEYAYTLVTNVYTLSGIKTVVSGGHSRSDTTLGTMWKDIDLNDAEAVKGRMKEIADLIGDLASRIDQA